MLFRVPVPLGTAANEMLNACRGLGRKHHDFVTVYATCLLGSDMPRRRPGFRQCQLHRKTRERETVRAGPIILVGSTTPPIWVAPEKRWVASPTDGGDFPDYLGTVPPKKPHHLSVVTKSPCVSSGISENPQLCSASCFLPSERIATCRFSTIPDASLLLSTIHKPITSDIPTACGFLRHSLTRY